MTDLNHCDTSPAGGNVMKRFFIVGFKLVISHLVSSLPCYGSIMHAVRLAIGVIVLSGLILPGDVSSQDAAPNDPFADARNELVKMRIQAAGVTNTKVLDAIRNTPRHEFVPAELHSQA